MVLGRDYLWSRVKDRFELGELRIFLVVGVDFSDKNFLREREVI